MKAKNNIKELRTRKGFSQEELAEKSTLSLRTIQRIENGQTEPLGDSLKKIAYALNVNVEDLIDWAIQEDKVFLKILNLSSLSFLLFPLLGAIIPFFMWKSKKNNVKGITRIGSNVVNFQLTWNLLLFLGVISITIATIAIYENPSVVKLVTYNGRFLSVMYTLNFLLVIFNAILILQEKPLRYYPKINFL